MLNIIPFIVMVSKIFQARVINFRLFHAAKARKWQTSRKYQHKNQKSRCDLDRVLFFSRRQRTQIKTLLYDLP